MATDNDPYIANYLKARTALLTAKARLAAMSVDLGLDESEQAAAQFALLLIAEQIADLDDAHTVAKASYQAGVNGPPQALIDKSLDIATRLGKVIAKAKKAQAILEAVIQLTDAWKKITDA